jgi:F0F1-type ATP synthase assembly protein I
VALPLRIVIWQLLTLAAVVVVLFIWEVSRESWEAPWWGLIQTVSALAAGMACVIPAGFYAWRAAAERSATRFLLQGVLKFTLTLVLVAVGIVLIKPAAAGFFGTFFLMQAMYVIAPLMATGAKSRT